MEDISGNQLIKKFGEVSDKHLRDVHANTTHGIYIGPNTTFTGVDSYTDVQRQQIGTSTLNNGDHLLVLDTDGENYNVMLSKQPFLAGLIPINLVTIPQVDRKLQIALENIEMQHELGPTEDEAYLAATGIMNKVKGGKRRKTNKKSRRGKRGKKSKTRLKRTKRKSNTRY